MSRHQPEHGADSAEALDPRDTSCDYCGRTIYDGSLRPQTLGKSTAWLCGECRARDEQRYAESAA